MSLEFFEHFLRTEISRHPSLGAALQLKSNLRRCSQQFERAVAELHYRLIKAAVQHLFSRVSSARLHELSSSAASSSCETKYAASDSSQKGSPNSRSSQATENEQCSSRWDVQSNNSQGIKPTPRSPSRRRGVSAQQNKLHQQQQHQHQNQHQHQLQGQITGNRWLKAKDANQQQQQQHQQQQQPQSHSQQQQHQYQQCQEPEPQRRGSCAQPQPCPVPRRQPPPPPPPSPQSLPPAPPRPRPSTREGPSYSYPTAGQHNRQAMSGWYVANMDALLSNLMRLFEMIYRDTLRMCGADACDLRQLRSALPDPTLLSMQQRTSGAWRPNFMNCKIDFLLHIAAMVYRNTQDIRCGCQCSMPADPCWPSFGAATRGDGQPQPPLREPQPGPALAQVSFGGWIPRQEREGGPGSGGGACCVGSLAGRAQPRTANRNNGAAVAACGCHRTTDTSLELDSSSISTIIAPRPAAAAAASCHHHRRRRRSHRRSRRSRHGSQRRPSHPPSLTSASSATTRTTTGEGPAPIAAGRANNCNSAGRPARSRQRLWKVGRSRAHVMVVSMDESSSSSSSSSRRSSSRCSSRRSSSRCSSSSTADTGTTCLSVVIQIPL